MKGVSVIICCYNAAFRIAATLQHLQKQKLTTSIDWEVIVVDNASSDDSSRIAREEWSKNPVTRLTIVQENTPGQIYARMSGIAAAAYEFISFIDDDNWVEQSWIEKVYETLHTDDRTGACGGKTEAVFERDPPEWFRCFEHSFAVGRQAGQSGYIEHTKGYLWGAGLSFRKSIWNELQKRGFKNLTTGRAGEAITAGDDTELCFAIRMLGYRLYYRDDLVLKHYLPASRLHFSYVLKLHEGFGKSFVRLNCYRVLLSPDKFRLRNWLYEWLAGWKKIIFIKLALFFIPDKTQRREKKAELAYWKGYVLQTWQDKNSTQKFIAELKTKFLS